MAGFPLSAAFPTRAQFQTQWGQARAERTNEVSERRHHPLSTGGARRATSSASRGAERSAAPTNVAPKVRRANLIGKKAQKERHTPHFPRARWVILAEVQQFLALPKVALQISELCKSSNSAPLALPVGGSHMARDIHLWPYNIALHFYRVLLFALPRWITSGEVHLALP